MGRLRPGENQEIKQETETTSAKYLPYVGQEELPDPVLDKRGRFKAAGGVRYMAIPSYTPQGNKYKIMAVYKKPAGIVRKLEKILMPYKKNTRGRADKATLEELKAAKIPGIY